jgi:hypothetical protein
METNDFQTIQLFDQLDQDGSRLTIIVAVNNWSERMNVPKTLPIVFYESAERLRIPLGIDQSYGVLNDT